MKAERGKVKSRRGEGATDSTRKWSVVACLAKLPPNVGFVIRFLPKFRDSRVRGMRDSRNLHLGMKIAPCAWCILSSSLLLPVITRAAF